MGHDGMTCSRQEVPAAPAAAGPPAARSVATDVLAQAVRGLAWTYASFAGSKVLVFVSTVILARLLSPAEFGQVAVALLVINYLETVGNLGISAALIYERQQAEQAANIAFIISLLTGGVWLLLALTAAPLAATFFKDPAVDPILKVMAWVFVITALGNTHDTLLQRELAFRQRLIPDFAQALLKGLCSVVLALLGWGVWSLVWGQLIGALAATLALWLVVRWRPHLQCPWDLTRRMLRYGGQIVSVNILAMITHHVDYLIVGRMLGSAALGFYTLAYRIPELVIIMMIWVIGNVTFPAYSRLQDDRPALQGAFLATLRYLSLLTIPAGIGLAMLGTSIVVTFYGTKWEPSIPVLQALAVAATLRSLSSHAGDIYKATGRPDILTELGLARAVVLVPALIFGARFGIAGVAVAQMVVTGASTLLNFFVASKILSLPMKIIAAELKPALLSSMVMVVSLQVLLPALSGWPGPLKLMVATGVGLAVYGLLTWFLSRDTVEKARAVIVSSFSKAV